MQYVLYKIISEDGETECCPSSGHKRQIHNDIASVKSDINKCLYSLFDDLLTNECTGAFKTYDDKIVTFDDFEEIIRLDKTIHSDAGEYARVVHTDNCVQFRSHGSYHDLSHIFAYYPVTGTYIIKIKRAIFQFDGNRFVTLERFDGVQECDSWLVQDLKKYISNMHKLDVLLQVNADEVIRNLRMNQTLRVVGEEDDIFELKFDKNHIVLNTYCIPEKETASDQHIIVEYLFCNHIPFQI